MKDFKIIRNFQFINLPTRNSTEEIFVIENFKDEFRRIVLPLLIIVATIQLWTYIVIDYISVGYRPDWIFVRIMYLPSALALYIIWKKKFRNHPKLYLLPVMFSLTYLSSCVTYFIVSADSYKDVYQLGTLQLLTGLCFIPLLARTFIVYFFIIIFSIYGVVFFNVRNDLSFDYITVFHYCSAYFLTALLFFMVWKIRIERSQLQFQVNTILANQTETIRIQSDDLAQAKVYETVAQTVQWVAHDVRKPFYMLKSGIELIKPYCREKDALEIFNLLKQDIDKSLIKVNGTLKDIMYVVSNNRQHEKNQVHLNSIICDVIRDLDQIYPAKKCTITTNFSQDDFTVFGNENRISRATFNIIENSVQVVHGGGQIEISIEESNAYYLLLIKNNGPVIPKENVSKIFDPLFTQGKKSGTGLGLHISKIFFSEIEASISCKSSVEDGTVFTISIPKSMA